MNAEELLKANVPDIPTEAWLLLADAVEWVTEGTCTPTCMFARSDYDACQCRCEEAHHGVLVHFFEATEVEMSSLRWTRQMRRLLAQDTA